MTARPRLADLGCCAGGAARGYHAAGFDVTGWDIEPQKNYPYRFIQWDVLKQDPIIAGVNHEAFHASPSCKGYTALRTAHNAKTHAREIPAFVDWLNATGRPWVLENVEEAMDEMMDLVGRRCPYPPILLCGSHFGLGTQGHRLERHRLFLASFQLQPPEAFHVAGHLAHYHNLDIPVIGVYGGHARNRSAKFGGRTTKDRWVGGHKTAMAEALGLPLGVMTTDEMSEAIPPVYAEFIGHQLMREAMK